MSGLPWCQPTQRAVGVPAPEIWEPRVQQGWVSSGGTQLQPSFVLTVMVPEPQEPGLEHYRWVVVSLGKKACI